MRFLALLLAFLSLRAQTPLPPDPQVLANVRTRMLFNLEHQPNYTCVETIERTAREKSGGRIKPIDTLRLEVALVDGREMFAWPGSKKFEDSDVTKIVTSGAIGNGNFFTHAKALFGTRAAAFHYLGEEDFEGKKALRFNYEIPQALSALRIQVAKAAAVVAYHGSVYANPATWDVERLVVIADQLPPELMLASSEDQVDYAETRIGEGDFLLPVQSDLKMTGIAGGEEHNHVQFSSCRQFSGDSVISFSDAPDEKTTEAAPASVREFDLPPDLEVELELTRDIDLPTAAIGDPAYARVRSDVKHKGQIVIPKGATAIGRIVRLEKRENYSILGLEFPEIEAPGMLARMKGSISRTYGVMPLVPRRNLTSPAALLPGEGIIPINPSQHRLSHGCIMFWRT